VRHALLALTALTSLVASSARADSIKLFDAVPVTNTGASTDVIFAAMFGDPNLAGDTGGAMYVSLDCRESPVQAIVSNKPNGTGGIVVDNFIAVNGVNVCRGGRVDKGPSGTTWKSCFIGYYGPTPVPAFRAAGGDDPIDAFEFYTPVPPIDISSLIAPGRQVVTFALKDAGVIAANSDLYLSTNCRVLPQVPICHDGKTLNVANAAVKAHTLHHGDHPGPCP
jgi:hypothetical protein